MMRCKHMDYPFGLWIKQSFVFALTATLLIALASFTGGFMSTRSVVQICITFLVILIVAFNNICIHVYFRVEDPVKSPLYVKVISFANPYPGPINRQSKFKLSVKRKLNPIENPAV